MKLNRIALVVFTFAAFSARAAEPVKLMMGGPLLLKLIEPKKAEIEKAVGAPLQIRVGPPDMSIPAMEKNLIDLASFTIPPEEAFAIVEKKTNVKIDRSNYQTTEFTRINIKIGVHPSNPIKAISKEQMADILTGKITNWEPLTGEKLPIKIVFAKNYIGTITNVTKYYIKSEAVPSAQYVIDKDGLLKMTQQEKGILFFAPSPEALPNFSPKYLDSEVNQVTYFYIHKSASASARKFFEYLPTLAKQLQ